MAPSIGPRLSGERLRPHLVDRVRAVGALSTGRVKKPGALGLPIDVLSRMHLKLARAYRLRRRERAPSTTSVRILVPKGHLAGTLEFESNLLRSTKAPTP